MNRNLTLMKALARGLWLALALLIVNAPLIIVFLVSLSSSPIFDLPREGLSLRWYEKAFQLDSIGRPLLTSLQLALTATSVSLVLGTACALGLSRSRFPGRDLLVTMVLSPMMLPGVVVGIALLFYLRALGITNSFLSLFIAHVVITLPYIVRITLAGLSLFDFALVDAARTLGYPPVTAVIKVLVPNLAPSFVSAAVFAFLASFDNYAIALFVGDVYTVTLPIQIINYLSVSTDPVVAAISVILLLGTLVSLLITERLVGLQRLAGG
jgi:putative spermidine/putrescine transport system permease protein